MPPMRFVFKAHDLDTAVELSRQLLGRGFNFQAFIEHNDRVFDVQNDSSDSLAELVHKYGGYYPS